MERSLSIHRTRSLMLGALIGLLVWPASILASTPQKVPMEPVSGQVMVDGKPVPVRFVPTLTVTPEGKGMRGTLVLDADMGAVQERLTESLGGTKQYDECGQRVSLSEMRVVPLDGGLGVTGVMQLEQWACLFGKAPRLLLSGTVDIGAAATPVIEGTERVRLEVRITRAEPRGNLGKLTRIFNLEQLLSDLIEKEIRKSAPEGLVASLPDSLKRHRVALEQVAFTDRGQGRLGLHAEGSVHLPLGWVLGARR
ncbi:MAG: hypothetical protein OEY97_00250 [Nitrospirota bacterium]|nr:hypothetical protein [Nitrospirota bacterium]